LVSNLEADVLAGVWSPPSYDLADVFRRAESLAGRFTAISGARSLDVLHVAAAAELGSDVFVSGDDRQSELAEAAGIKVIRMRIRVRKSRRPTSKP
jgi:predicted nucleic acid-binding protein